MTASIDTGELAILEHLPVAAALVCAVSDRDADEVRAILTDRAVDLMALAVVLASLVPDDVEMPTVRPAGFADLLDTTSRLLRVPAAEITGRSRKRPVIDARHVLCAAARAIGMGWSDIGRNVGVDHSTVISAVQRVRQTPALAAKAAVVAGQCISGDEAA